MASRIVVFGLDNVSVGEIHANCNRGWAINNGGTATVDLSADMMAPWLDLGRMVMIEDNKPSDGTTRLPPWAGMIDTPWTASAPYQMTVYNAEYLLHIRCPSKSRTITGTTASIVAELVARANNQENLFVQMGNVDADPVRSEKFDQTPFWEQIQKMVKAAGMEMQLRPGRDANNRLIIYVDVKKQLGQITNFCLHDGAGGNCNITKALVDNEIYNQVSEIDTGQVKSQSDVFKDATSIAHYRLRSTVAQYSGTSSKSALNLIAQTTLANSKNPPLVLTIDALDVGDTFKYLQLGNTLDIQASKLRLPGAVKGWAGQLRIMAMQYDESKNVVTMTLTGSLQ